jgi:hypothetical protein
MSKVVAAFASLLILSSSGCAAIRGGLASASAAHIPGCSADELEVSNTYGANPTTGPKWKATCHDQVYECVGYMQLPSTVKCHELTN